MIYEISIKFGDNFHFRLHLFCSFCYFFMTSWTQILYRVRLKYLNEFQEWVSHTKPRKSSYKNMSFRGTDQQHVDIKPLDLYLWGHLKILVYSAPIENGETLNQHIFMPVNSQHHQYLQNGAALHVQTCPCMHLFRQKTFWAFVGNFVTL